MLTFLSLFTMFHFVSGNPISESIDTPSIPPLQAEIRLKTFEKKELALQEYERVRQTWNSDVVSNAIWKPIKSLFSFYALLKALDFLSTLPLSIYIDKASENFSSDKDLKEFAKNFNKFALAFFTNNPIAAILLASTPKVLKSILANTLYTAANSIYDLLYDSNFGLRQNTQHAPSPLDRIELALKLHSKNTSQEEIAKQTNLPISVVEILAN
jgi:hypothetical protein